jgi:predicted DNA-binding protein
MLNGFARVGAHPAVRARSKTISIRVEPDMLRRLQYLAARKGTRYQTLVKDFVTERLYEEEKREGIVGGE